MILFLNKIYSPEEERAIAEKALRLNGITGPVTSTTTTNTKPTVRIKRLGSSSQRSLSERPKLKGASSYGFGSSGNQSYHEHLASCELCRTVLQMEKANKGLRLATGL